MHKLIQESGNILRGNTQAKQKLNEAVDEDDMVELSMDVTDYFMNDLTSQIPKLFENAIKQAIDNSDLDIDRDDYENLKKESIDSISDVVRDAGSSLVSDEL